jgi:hypothetical protein
MKPTNAPAMSSMLESPQVSIKLARFMDFSNNSLISYIQQRRVKRLDSPAQNPLLSTVLDSWL